MIHKICSSKDGYFLENEFEEAILDYAVEYFPYGTVFENYDGNEKLYRKTLDDLLDTKIIRIGFYYEDLQEDLMLFYFLKIAEENFAVLGFDPGEVQVNIPNDVSGLFRLDDDQYTDLIQMKLN